MIELRADLPKWQQVVKVIRTRIETGELPPGGKITERGLIEEFEVAGGTARKAIKALREAGLIYTRVNLGSFVGPEPDDDDS
ncbi:winged helix-turn-helix domain-containing protein [Streptosporangium sp. NPDC006930]|uniref:winged helix-turn-helix domain-containing protein n=1 Tax=Streptosporangium sp. NPDC006930 TaxID=3154783 RepID=UPI0034269F0D